ncbi:MAG TPA: class I SAM-dependent methyltransferase [Gaiellaceae bacterium]|jgi:SAM-dependent methyltransferase
MQAIPPARGLRFALVAEALERFAAGRALNVLDAGCGDGAFAAAIARRQPGWSVVGVDVADSMLERGRAATAGMPNVELLYADVTEGLGNEVYDAVASIEALEEIPDDTAALRSMVAALRPGGLLVAHVPERNWKPVLPGSDPTWRHEVRHGYDADELAQRLHALGLVDIRVEETSRGLVRAAQELRDRVPSQRPRLRGAVSSVLAFTVPLERAGLTWGRGRSLFVRAVAR